MKRVEKIIIKELQRREPLLEFFNEGVFYFEDDEIYKLISIDFKKLGGENYLRYHCSIEHKKIEAHWLKYRDLLGYTPFYVSTTNFDLRNFRPDFFNSGFGLNWDKISSFNSETNIINDIIDNYTLPLFNKYSSLIEIDKRINETDNVRKCMEVTEQTGLPYRKVLVARTINNPRTKEIEENMRIFCEETYQYGVENNKEKDKACKYVFEELFGK